MTVVTFGAVPGGKLSDDFKDYTASGEGPNGVGTFVLDSEIAPGKKKLRLVANAEYSPVYYKDPSTVRIHLSNNDAVQAMMEPKGQTFSRCFTFKWDAQPVFPLYAGDEIHGGKEAILGQGPAPLNNFWSTGSAWNNIVRGGGNPNVKGSYIETRFGWPGNAIAPGQWVHSFAEYVFSPDSSKGSYAYWVAPHLLQMANVYPAKRIATCFPDPIKHYPIVSCYYVRSVKGWHIVEITASAYCRDAEELRAWQADNVGYNPWGPTVTKLWEVSRDPTTDPPTITLGYKPTPGAYGYRYFADGVPKSTSYNPNQSTIRFALGAKEYAVLPLVAGELLTFHPA